MERLLIPSTPRAPQSAAAAAGTLPETVLKRDVSDRWGCASSRAALCDAETGAADDDGGDGSAPTTPELAHGFDSPASAYSTATPANDSYQTPSRDSLPRFNDSWTLQAHRAPPSRHDGVELRNKAVNTTPAPAAEKSFRQRLDEVDRRRIASEDLTSSLDRSRFFDLTPRTSISSDSGSEATMSAVATGMIFSNKKRRPVSGSHAAATAIGRCNTPGTAPASPVVGGAQSDSGFDSNGVFPAPHKCASDLRVFEVVGEGAHGVVHRASWRGRTCAVKRCHDKAAERYLRRECQVSRAIATLAAESARRVECPVLEVLAEVQHAGKYALVAPLANGDLWQVVQRGSISSAKLDYGARSLSATARLVLATKAADALADLHALDVVHSDIKPQNFVVLNRSGELATALALSIGRRDSICSTASTDGSLDGGELSATLQPARTATRHGDEELHSMRVALIDLENAYSPVAKNDALRRSGGAGGASEVVGTSVYTAPELLVRHRLQLSTPPASPQLSGGVARTSSSDRSKHKEDFAADVFSFGCTLLALFTGEEPLAAARTVLERTVWAQRGDPIRYLSARGLQRFDALQDTVKAAIRGCLSADSTIRPTASDVAKTLRAAV